jgi:CDP-diacylglycerol--glycerol-3-phosphate 3-phosphatidyltransferase
MSLVGLGSAIPPRLRERVRGLAEPVALGLGRLGFSPDGLTAAGFAISLIAAGAAALEAWLLAGIVSLLGAIFDLFDGALARATGRTSRFGAFLDSSVDRAGEAAVYVGIVTGCAAAGFALGAVLAGAAMASAFLVSYVRARAEGLGFAAPLGMAAVGLAPRELRVVLLGIGLIATGLAGGVGPGDLILGRQGAVQPAPHGAIWLAATLALIAILSTLTVLQRIAHVRRQAAKEDQPS